MSTSEVLSNQGGPSWREVNKCDTHLQEEMEEGSEELQACRCVLTARDCYGSDHL